MPGMVDRAETPEETARKAGFPMTPIPGYYSPPPGTQPAPPVQNVPKAVLAPGVTVAMKAPSAGTTELIPGATDWIRNLVSDMMPSRPAAAATMGQPQPAGTLPFPPTNSRLAQVSGAPNPNIVGPPAPQPSFFARFIRGLTGPEPDVSGHGGVRS